MSAAVLRAGVLSTVQDLGRRGLQCYGVPVSGAMDAYSLCVANLLVGNEPSAAALEMTLDGPTLEFDADTLLAISGADLAPEIDGHAVPELRPLWVCAGAQLKFGLSRRGCRGYLAVAGGIDVPQVLASRSTYLRGRFGGFEGRALKHGDRLPIAVGEGTRFANMHAQLAASKSRFVAPHWAASAHPERLERDPQAIRFVPGRHWEALGSEARNLFLHTEYRVGSNSDRMGYRLEGGTLEHQDGGELPSESTVFGTIQLPPDGNPIVLMADRQTTGGYPRVGEVCSVDLSLLAQVRPGARVKFERITLAEAQRLWHLQSEAILQIRASVAAQMDHG